MNDRVIMGPGADGDSCPRSTWRLVTVRTTVWSSCDQRTPLRLSVSGLRRKIAVIVVVAVALSGLVPEGLGADLRRYSVPDDRMSVRVQTDRLANLLRFISKRRSFQVGVFR